MDRGWRRSGSLLYLPDVSRSCCPHYTIRLSAREFHATRDQRQALHRWNRFVLGEEYINEVAKKYPKTKAEKKKQNTTFDLISALHESEVDHLKPSVDPAHRFEVTLEPDKFTEEKFALFENYQSHVHHEKDTDISRNGFRRFLCNSPIHRPDEILTTKPIGSFHQMYRLDGRLIAMSVLDLLPRAVSGVYFIYHSDFSAHSFGKLSALREAALAIEINYELYYMGYFIWSCKKMRYKGDYRPQQVLDYDTGEWDIMDEKMTKLMDKRPWVSMSRERFIERELADPNNADLDLTEEKVANTVYKVSYPKPVDAMNAGLSILELGLPGAMKLEELLAKVDLDRMKLSLGWRSGGSNDGSDDDEMILHETRDLALWHAASVTDSVSIKGFLAELIACVGAELSGEIIVDLHP